MAAPTLSSELLSAVHAVQRRVRVQRALEAIVARVPIAAGLLAGITLVDHAHLVDGLPVGGASWTVAAVLMLMVIGAWRRPINPVAAAWRIDEALGTSDRLAAAVDFAQRPAPTSWMRAAIGDAEGRLEPDSIERAAPLCAPRQTRLALWMVAVWLSSTIWVLPVGEAQGAALATLDRPSIFQLRAESLDRSAHEELAAAAAALETRPESGLDARVAGAIEDLNALIRGLRSGELRLETAHQRLASLEARLAAFEKAQGKDTESELRRAQKAGKKGRKAGRDVNPLLEAIRAARWKEAAEALEALSPKNAKARRRLGRDLDRLSKRLESKRARQGVKLRKERRRLKRKEKTRRLGRRDRRRLQRNKRALERLEREAARSGETGRRLARLERALRSAAQDLLRRSQGSNLPRDAMKRAADALRRLGEGATSRKRMRVILARSEAIRELLRRAARRKRDGQEPKDQDEDGRRRFLRLAEGGDPGAGDGKKGGGKTKATMTLLVPGGESGGSVSVAGSGAGQGDGTGDGDGVGQGHDPALLGPAERLDVRTHDVNVAGEDGEGASTSRVVASAARRGFATRGWGRVHQDYEEVVEERMERQEIPAGHRRYVRRYFDLIRPR
jgi:hypothetical protein